MDWIPELAEPYLRGYRPVRQGTGALRGYWFFVSYSKAVRRAGSPSGRGAKAKDQRGFFAGYLVKPDGFQYLTPVAPECLIFVFVRPVGNRAHRRWVAAPESPLRWTFNYIRYLTHRPPRFEFYERELAAMVRHTPLLSWSPAKRRHLSRNFFVETLAWLVRSGIVRKLSSQSRRGVRE